MNKENQIFNIKAIHYEGWELHVKAEDYEEAYEFIDKLRKGENVDFKQMEFDLDAPTRIEKIVDVKSEKPTIIFDNTEGVSMDKELKYGYDCESEKYIMTLVTEYIQNRNVEAENKEQAIRRKIGKDVSILKRKGKPFTLKELRKSVEGTGVQLSFDELCDTGGCGCFVDEMENGHDSE